MFSLQVLSCTKYFDINVDINGSLVETILHIFSSDIIVQGDYIRDSSSQPLPLTSCHSSPVPLVVVEEYESKDTTICNI